MICFRQGSYSQIPDFSRISEDNEVDNVLPGTSEVNNYLNISHNQSQPPLIPLCYTPHTHTTTQPILPAQADIPNHT